MHVGPVEPARLLFCVRSSVPRRPIKRPKVGEGPPFIHLEQASGLTDQQCCGTFVTPRESSTTMRAGCWEAAHLTRLRSVPAGPRGLRTRNVFSATLHPASAGPRHPDQELARTAARTARPSVQLPRLRRPSRRHHAFHTGARRWNRGHSRDLAKSTNSKRMGLEGRLSPTFPREQNPELYSSTLYGKDVRPAEANHRSKCSVDFHVTGTLQYTLACCRFWACLP